MATRRDQVEARVRDMERDKPGDRRGSFLTRLARDARGNVLAMMCMAMIPMIGMIGSGVDMTRAYMAQNRFRQACDAGALAGRRLLAGTAINNSVRDETTKYFAFNFPQGAFQANTYTLTITAPATGTLRVVSSTTIPTTIMKMFGLSTLPISTSCSATQDFVNTDVMLVFDLSGSMNCPTNKPNDNCGEVNQPNSKLNALKDAAKALYTTLEPAQTQLADNNLRLRYGFVNYSSGVNVGAAVYAKNPNYFVSRWTYQSREPAIDENGRSANWCSNRSGSVYYYNGNEYRCRYPSKSNNANTWLYRPVEHDVASYLSGGTPYLASRDDDSAEWNGCIEERDTDSSTIDGGSGTTAPSSAYDLDIDKIPDSDATRWRPVWPDTEYLRYNVLSGISRAQEYCPTAARRLQNYNGNKSSFDNYINGLRAIGSTYHDLGIIWGARFISTTGIFAALPTVTNDNTVADNPSKIRGFQVKKYMIFMTDGDMSPSNVYSAYGVEGLDQRVTGGNGNQLNRHLQRFRMACNAAKSKGIDIWVIAFSTSLTSDMEKCASKPSQASGIADKDALIAKFQEIGSKIGSLRLSE